MSDIHLETVGIIGAGAKGRDVAVYALLGGYRVILEDISSSRLAEATAHAAAALDAEAARQKFGVRRRRAIAANFSTTQSMDDVSRAADLLIEAAPEDAELQLEIFTIFDKFAKPQAVLASMAQSIAVADLAEMTNCPERCIGLQFPVPLSSDRSVRIIRAPKTGERTLQACAAFARQLGFDPKFVIESPNFFATVRELHQS